METISNNNILAFQKAQAAKILGSYGIETGSIEKSEGARGGHVIGHTKSGKPIYNHASHSAHKNFTPDEHGEASDLHVKLWNDTKDSDPDEAEKHSDNSDRHYAYGDMKYGGKFTYFDGDE